MTQAMTQTMPQPVAQQTLDRIRNAEWRPALPRDLAFADDSVRSVLVDEDGNIWAAVFRNHDTGRFFCLPLMDALEWTCGENPPTDVLPHCDDVASAQDAGRKWILEAAPAG